MTVAQKHHSKKNFRAKRIKGICSAADELGVTRMHLWAVLKGHRKSVPLMERYQALQNQLPVPSAQQQPVNSGSSVKKSAAIVRNPALENLEPLLFDLLSKLKIELAIVMFDASPKSPIWATIGLEKQLGAQLEADGAGYHDSSEFVPGSQWHFFYVKKGQLGKAMATLKAAIEAKGLLEITTIFHAESAKELRVWYPATADLKSLKLEAPEA